MLAASSGALSVSGQGASPIAAYLAASGRPPIEYVLAKATSNG